MKKLSLKTLCKINAKKSLLPLVLSMSVTILLTGCGDSKVNRTSISGAQQQLDGREAFRAETFGNEGFWTDAARLPQGIVAAGLTPVQALQAGLSVNIQALDAATVAAVADEIKNYGTTGPILNNPATTIKLLNANSVIGVVVKDTNNDGVLDVARGDKVGISCVLCHGITDKSALNVPTGGSIGVQIDGPATHTIHIGKIFALAANTRAFYPMAQLKGADGKSIGRAPSAQGLTKTSTEAQFDAYFANETFYPIGMFDDTVDGNGNPMHNTPLFRQDLAAPFGTAGELATFPQFANTVFTALLDPTNLLSPGGRAFLNTVAGAAGDKVANDYAEVLASTSVTNYPYIKVSRRGAPGTPDTLLGIGVDETILNNMTAYVSALRSPAGVIKDVAAVARGKIVFEDTNNNCLSCHNADQSQPVKGGIVPMATIFPGDAPVVLGTRTPPLSPILDTPGNTFDDKMIVINASLRGLVRGAAMPLLMDLARKPTFLHDDSVWTLNALFVDRGWNEAHPFYVTNSTKRADLVQYLESLDDTVN